MGSKSIIDSRLWIRLDLDTTLKANSFYHTHPWHRAHFATQLLLYDQIVIPTKDFGILPILMSWMGYSALQEALETDSIAFVRPKSLIGYAGNGNAISGFEIQASKEKPFNWYQESLFGSMEDAPELQLRYQCPFLSREERLSLKMLTLQKSRQMEWDNDSFMKQIVNESYTDIIDSPELAQFVMAHEPGGIKSINLTNLSGVEPNQFRVLNLEQIKDGVDLVLRVAEINLELLMAELYGDADLCTSAGAETLLQKKLIRSGAVPELAHKFQSLLELENIPDIRPVIAEGEISVREIWRLRQKRESIRFREWLREGSYTDGRELEKAYVSSLGAALTSLSLPARIFRFILTTAVGTIGPITGVLAGVVDNFFVEKWLSGYSPRLFVDQIRALPGKPND